MKVFEYYLFRNLLKNLLLVVFILALIIGGRLLIELSANIAHGSYPTDVVSLLLLLSLTDTMIHLLPFCALLAIILSLGSLYQNNEIYAAYTICISKSDIYRVLLRFALPLSMLLFYLLLEIMPVIQQQIDFIKQEARQRADLSIIKEGRLSRIDRGVLFVEQLQNNQLKGVFVMVGDDERMTVTTAQQGRQMRDAAGLKQLHLDSGEFYRSQASTRNEVSFYTIDYKSHYIDLPKPAIPTSKYKPENLDFLELWQADSLATKAELQMRLSIPLVLLVLLPFVEWLSRSSPKRYRQYAKLTLGIIVFLVYSNVAILMSSLVESGKLPAVVGVWPLHLVVFMTAVALAARRDLY